VHPAVDNRKAGAKMTTVPVQFVSDRQPPGQESTMRLLVQPNMEWLVSVFADLEVGRRSRRASGPAG
jgi:hypothetical protein